MNNFSYIECSCLSPQHVLRIYKNDYNEISFEIYLNPYYPWYSRLWIAFKYVVGYNRSGAWDEILLDKNGQQKLRDLLDET